MIIRGIAPNEIQEILTLFLRQPSSYTVYERNSRRQLFAEKVKDFKTKCH